MPVVPWQILTGLRIIIESNANSTAVMAIVLSDDCLSMQLPQTRIVVAASCNEIGRVGAESTVPNPTLVTGESAFKLERSRLRELITAPNGAAIGTVAISAGDRNRGGCRVAIFAVRACGHCGHLVEIFDFPDFSCVVCTASGQVLDVGGKKNTSDKLRMRLEVGDRDKRGLISILVKSPDKNVTL